MIELSGSGGPMTQQTLAGFEKYGKTTRRAQFLAEMEQVVPWAQLCALIEPVYPKGGSGAKVVGRQCHWNGCCGSTCCEVGSPTIAPACLSLPRMTCVQNDSANVQ
jgi:IS5 family transposase